MTATQQCYWDIVGNVSLHTRIFQQVCKEMEVIKNKYKIF